jgi:hypothetical protein
VAIWWLLRSPEQPSKDYRHTSYGAISKNRSFWGAQVARQKGRGPATRASPRLFVAPGRDARGQEM